MTGKGVLGAALAVLAAAALVVISYRLGRGRDHEAREAAGEVVRQRLGSLDAIEKRLERLEAEVGSLRRAQSAVAPEAAAGATADAEARWAAAESALSTLQLRVDGLEQDPVRRGYSYLASENAEMRREGVNILRRVASFDPEARAAIRAVLHDPSARVREQAAQMLRDLGDRESAPEMLALLADADAATRRRAVQALGAMDAAGAVRDLGQSLVSDADDAVREAAAGVLRRLKSRDAEPFLVEALKDGNQNVRGEAIVALGELGATSAAPQLRAIYDQDPGNHRLRLALALKSLGDEAPLQTELGRLSELARSDADERVRRQAIRDLAALDRTSARPVFAQALEDPSPLVRREAERALR